MQIGSTGHPKAGEMGRKHGPSRGETPRPSHYSGRLRVNVGTTGIVEPAAGPAESCQKVAGHHYSASACPDPAPGAAA